MQLFLTIFHVVLCIALILIILLQPGKDQGAVFGGGGGGNRMYAPRGQSNLLGKATTAVAVLFAAVDTTAAEKPGVITARDAEVAAHALARREGALKVHGAAWLHLAEGGEAPRLGRKTERKSRPVDRRDREANAVHCD